MKHWKYMKYMRYCYFVVAAVLIAVTMAVPAAAPPQDGNLPIILYHNITYNYTRDNHKMHVDPARLEEQLRAIKDAGYNTIFLEDYVNYLEGKAVLPEKPLVITFDDGYMSNYEYAFPLLKKYGMKATIFVITSRMGTRETQYPHFTWEQAREMENSGVIRIESHTNTHPDMSAISPQEQEEEIRRSKYLLDTNLHKDCKMLAFPYGRYTEGAIELAKKAGFELSVLVGDRGSNKKENGAYHLKRFTVSGLQTGQELVDHIEYLKQHPDE